MDPPNAHVFHEDNYTENYCSFICNMKKTSVMTTPKCPGTPICQMNLLDLPAELGPPNTII